MLRQFGEIVGHAIAATERKQALISDEVVEFEVYVPDFLEAIGIDVAANGQINFDDVVATSDGTHLVYGTVTPNARKTLDALSTQHVHWDSVTILSEEADTTKFEAQVIEMPLRSGVASQGTSVEGMLLVDNELHLRLQHSPSVDVGSIVETVHAMYPTAQLLARRHIPRSGNSAPRLRQSLR